MLRQTAVLGYGKRIYTRARKRKHERYEGEQ